MTSLERKMKSVASIPPNYVSILQLQERWLKEKERKQKEEVKQQVGDGQGRREEKNVMMVGEAMEARVKLGEKEPTCFEENGGEDSRKKKKKWSKKKKKKKNQCASVEEVSQAYNRRENIAVKGEMRRDYMSKGETAVETQMQDLWISKRVKEEGETSEVKGPGRLSNGQSYYQNRKHDWSSRRDTRATGAVVWVKKEKNNGENGI